MVSKSERPRRFIPIMERISKENLQSGFMRASRNWLHSVRRLWCSACSLPLPLAAAAGAASFPAFPLNPSKPTRALLLHHLHPHRHHHVLSRAMRGAITLTGRVDNKIYVLLYATSNKIMRNTAGSSMFQRIYVRCPWQVSKTIGRGWSRIPSFEFEVAERDPSPTCYRRSNGF